MEQPNVLNVYHDTSRDVRYEFLTYRPFTEEELRLYAEMFIRSQRKKPKRGTTIRVTTAFPLHE